MWSLYFILRIIFTNDEKKAPRLFLFIFWSLLTRNVHVLVLISTLNPFRRGSGFSPPVELLVPSFLRLFLMVSKCCFSFFRLELFWIYMDVANDYFCCNNLDDHYAFKCSNYIAARQHFA